MKSGYWLGTHLPGNDQPIPTYGNIELKAKIWKTKVPTKLKHFFWKLMSLSLATGINLKRRHVIRDAVCRRCCNAEETEDHIFFECEYAKEIWRASGISNLTILSNLTSLEDKIGACLQMCMPARLKHFQDLPLWILWRLLKGRNVLVFQQKHTHWMNIIR